MRNKRLVWVCWREYRDPETQKVYKSAELELYNTSQLCDHITHHAVDFWIKILGSNRHRPIHCSAQIANALIAQRHYHVPEIVGIVNSPTLDFCLSLLTKPGYNAAMQIYYLPSEAIQLPDIPDKPTRDDALAALKLFNELLNDFAFDGEFAIGKHVGDKSVARSGALAGILTTVARPILGKAVPLFVVTAPDYRIGKTYLIDLKALIATGHIAIHTSGAEKKEELEKRVETAAMAGSPVMVIDNLPNNTVVRSDRLAELSTGGQCDIRLLGKHQRGRCDCRATTIFLNGTSITISEDLVPRSVHIRLNPEMEHPEEREFTKPYPHERVLADRGKYLAAAFTIIKAYQAAGAPEQVCKRVAGFERWSKLIQQVLVWLDQPDPLGAIEALRVHDPAYAEITKLLLVLRQVFPTPDEYRSITVAKCKELANIGTAHDYAGRPAIFKYPELRELMTDERGQINTKKFGNLLVRALDKVRGGWSLKVSEKKEHGSNVYYLVGPEPEARAWDAPAAASTDATNGEAM